MKHYTDEELYEQNSLASKEIHAFRKKYGGKRNTNFRLIQRVIQKKYGLFIPLYYPKSRKKTDVFKLIGAIVGAAYLTGRIVERKQR